MQRQLFSFDRIQIALQVVPYDTHQPSWQDRAKRRRRAALQAISAISDYQNNVTSSDHDISYLELELRLYSWIDLKSLTRRASCLCEQHVTLR